MAMLKFKTVSDPRLFRVLLTLRSMNRAVQPAVVLNLEGFVQRVVETGHVACEATQRFHKNFR